MHKQTGSIAIPIASNDGPEGELGPVTEYRVQAFDVADEYFDFQFMGRASQCGDEKSCLEFEREFEWDEFMTEEEQNKVSATEAAGGPETRADVLRAAVSICSGCESRSRAAGMD